MSGTSDSQQVLYKPQPVLTRAEFNADILAIENEAEGQLDGLLVAKTEA
jgi:hypothetical protein